MKKIISIMAAGVLFVSTTSAFANANWAFEEKHGSSLGWASSYTTLSETIPTQISNNFSFEKNSGDTMKIMGAERASGDYCLMIDSSNSNCYLKYTATGQQHTKMSMDIKITGENGVRLKWRETGSSYRSDKDVMEFKTDGTIAVWERPGYSSDVKINWEKNKWYNITLIVDKTGDTSGAPFTLELREENAKGKLINSWIGLTSGCSQVSQGASMACFVSQGATTYYLDNPAFGFMSDKTVDPKNYDDPSPYTVTKFVADGKIVNDIASMKGKTVYAEFSVKDTDLTATSSKLVIASYDANKKLQTLDMAEAFLEDAKLSSANIAVPADAAEVKMFIWDLGAGFKPLVDAIVVNK